MIDINDQYKVASKQRKLLLILKDFHAFCTTNGIAYSIIGGTLLGAIREKGFIPWDDDIDVLMDRANFEKLAEAMDRFSGYRMEEPLWVFKIVCSENDQRQGIQDDAPVLDIFIADRVPSGGVRKRIKLLGLKLLQGMLKTGFNENKNFSIASRAALTVTRLLGKLFSSDRKKRMYTAVSKWGNNETGQPLMICNDIFQSLGCEYDPKLMDSYINIRFEDTELMAIENWDNYLKEQYGDYMKPVRTEH